MSRNRPINAYIIDDNQDYIDSLVISARKKGIILRSSNNLETGMDSILNNKSIEFVILDGKCFVDEDKQKSGQTVPNIPIRAKGQIDDINRTENRTIGYCVNTGFDELHETFEGVFEIFNKDSAEDLLKYIVDVVSNSETYKVKNKHAECFTAFDRGTIDIKYEYLLIDLLKSLEKKDFRKKNFSPMRDLLEASFLGLMTIECIPREFLNDKELPILAWCSRYLEQRPTDDSKGRRWQLDNPVPKEMKSTISKLKEATSAYKHLGDDEIIKIPFQANMFLLMEYLIWLPTFHQDYYK